MKPSPVGSAAAPCSSSAESAKRHLVVELDTLGFRVVGKDVDPENGLAFDMLSSAEENVVIGHADGVITIDLAAARHPERYPRPPALQTPHATVGLNTEKRTHRLQPA